MTAQTAREPSRSAPTSDEGPVVVRRPLYPRLLRLRHLQLREWQRVLLGDGSSLLAVLLVLADLATAWTLVVLPLAVAVVVKLHDVAAGLLATGSPAAGQTVDPPSADLGSVDPAAGPQTPTAPVPQDQRRRRR